MGSAKWARLQWTMIVNDKSPSHSLSGLQDTELLALIKDDRQKVAIIPIHALIILATCVGNIMYSSSDIGRITTVLDK